MGRDPQDSLHSLPLRPSPQGQGPCLGHLPIPGAWATQALPPSTGPRCYCGVQGVCRAPVHVSSLCAHGTGAICSVRRLIPEPSSSPPCYLRARRAP